MYLLFTHSCNVSHYEDLRCTCKSNMKIFLISRRLTSKSNKCRWISEGQLNGFTGANICYSWDCKSKLHCNRFLYRLLWYLQNSTQHPLIFIMKITTWFRSVFFFALTITMIQSKCIQCDRWKWVKFKMFFTALPLYQE